MSLKNRAFQKGKTKIFLLLIVIGAIGVVFLQQIVPNSRKNSPQVSAYCRPEVDAEGLPLPNAPSIEAPTYTFPSSEPQPSDGNPLDDSIAPQPGPPAIFKLVKSRVPLAADNIFYSDSNQRQIMEAIWNNSSGSDTFYCPLGVIPGVDNYDHHHFCFLEQPAIFPTPKPNEIAAKYGIMYPKAFSAAPGRGSRFRTELSDGEAEGLFYKDYQLIFLVYLNASGKPIALEGTNDNGDLQSFYLADVYQIAPIVDPYKKLPDEVLKCIDPPAGRRGSVSLLLNPSGQPSPDRKQLQLEHFIIETAHIENTWYYPQCKPAVYLYPEKETKVQVQVHSKGMLTYTDPLYPKEGWKTTAFPDGKLLYEGKEYPYLYYESKIRDEYIKKPTKGYVVSYGDLSSIFDMLLPKLGLNEKEAREFKEYWLSALPFSPYYFVGVMSEQNIDEIEPLQIFPNPDTMVRVRLYFEAESLWKAVEPPEFNKKERNGFTVVEWGGMVKLNKGEEFTCSQ